MVHSVPHDEYVVRKSCHDQGNREVIDDALQAIRKLCEHSPALGIVTKSIALSGRGSWA